MGDVTQTEVTAAAFVAAAAAARAAEGGHVLVDNCGLITAEMLRELAPTIDMVMLERDEAIARAVGRHVGEAAVVGSSLSYAYPDGSFNLALMSADPADAGASVATALSGLAEGGLLVAVVPTTLTDGDGWREAIGPRHVVGRTRIESGLEARTPAADVLVIVNRAQAGEPVLPGLGRDDVLGEMHVSGGLAYVSGMAAGETARRLSERVARQVRDGLGSSALVEAAPTSRPALALRKPAREAMYDLVQDAGGGWWTVGADGLAERVAAGGTARARLAADAVALAAQARALVEAESDPEAQDAALDAGIESLRAAHQSFVDAHGPACGAAARRVVGPLSWTGHLLSQLERIDKDGEYAGPSDMLLRRVRWPETGEAAMIRTPDEALSASIARTGSVDLGLILRAARHAGEPSRPEAAWIRPCSWSILLDMVAWSFNPIPSPRSHQGPLGAALPPLKHSQPGRRQGAGRGRGPAAHGTKPALMPSWGRQGPLWRSGSLPQDGRACLCASPAPKLLRCPCPGRRQACPAPSVISHEGELALVAAERPSLVLPCPRATGDEATL